MPSSQSRIRIAIIAAIIVVLIIALYLFIHRGEEYTDDAAIDGRIVTISAKVSGYVTKLNIDDNQLVKAGDVLLEIDETDYVIRRDHAEAALEAAEAASASSQSNVDTTNIQAPSNLDAAQAQVEAADANWRKALSDLHRMQRLTNEARSKEQLDQAVASEKAAHSNLLDAKAKYRSAQTAPNAIAAAKANSDELLAKVKQAQADLAQAESDLANTKLVAPMDGRITRRGVERGDYVQPAQQLASLVGVDLWITANFKETQLEHMKIGQPVTIKIDAFPSAKIEGRIDSLQSGTGSYFSAFPPENATGNFVKIVQRVPVKITFDRMPEASLELGPGMSVEPTVHTNDAPGQVQQKQAGPLQP